ncbi:WD40-repeat-containing domain protein [Zychaea mexicana]|uniref:WD40-repeat-containing domain protein n=1 Tax=Zychaea mexicana TaxID=64656 RepID=UPI0022FDE9B4|nr:WD40-repeat-containing domain protein [Zychaea mexicana]KAI9498289.1 WD40-repeat-containing domain protein [Zychaea mexicana]
MSRLGIGSNKRRGRKSNANEENATDNTSPSSSCSDDQCRRSGDSYYSLLFGHMSTSGLSTNTTPPHGGRYVKIKSGLRHNRDSGRILEAQTLSVKRGGQKYQSKDEYYHRYERMRMRPRDLLSRSFSASNALKASGIIAAPTDKNKSNIADNDNDKNEVDDPPGAVWAMKFSQDGRYMAAGGQKCVILVWKTREDRYTDNVHAPEGQHRCSVSQQPRQNDLEDEENGNLSQQTIKVFEDEPIRAFDGHTADILDICWSKKHFLISSSMDNTVMLWHISVQHCLCVFKHVDFVTSIAFHPFDDRIFLSTSADGKVRLWSIPGKSVLRWNNPADNNILTAASFTANGDMVCAGSYDGQVFLYNTDDMKQVSQFSVKKPNARRGHKITGIQAVPGLPSDNDKILVTSNDSLVRLYSVRDHSLIHQYKGAENESTQIKASLSDDGQLIICGSDKNTVHIWSTNPYSSPYLNDRSSQSEASLSHLITQFPDPSSTATRNNHKNISIIDPVHDNSRNNIASRAKSSSRNRSFSTWFHRNSHSGGGLGPRIGSTNCYFTAHHGIVACAIFAPTKTRQQLAASGEDIIYNHTHVPYIHRNYKENDNSIVRDDNGYDGSDAVSDAYTYNNNDSSSNPQQSRVNASSFLRISRSMLPLEECDKQEIEARLEHTYSEGQIIVTTDEKGYIKVWRIDSGIYDSSEATNSQIDKSNSNGNSKRVSSFSTFGGIRTGSAFNCSSSNNTDQRSRLSIAPRFNKK